LAARGRRERRRARGRCRCGVVRTLGVVGDSRVGVARHLDGAHLALSKFELLLLDGGALFAETLLGFLCLPATDGGEERLKVGEEVGFGHVKIPVEEAKKLLLHEVDFGDAEAEVVVTTDRGVASPVLVLGRGVVEVLCRENERSEEDTVDGAAHALCDRRKTLCQAVEVDQGSHKRRYLNVRASNESADEKLD